MSIASVATAAVEEFEASQEYLARQALSAAMASEDFVELVAQGPDGTTLVAAAIRASANMTNVTVSDGGVAVKVPVALVTAAGGGFMLLTFAVLGQESQTLAALQAAASSAAELAANPVSIVLLTANGTEWSGPLPEPLELTIPLNASNNTEATGECAFWDTSTNSWSTEGVSTLSVGLNEVVCQTTHLSLFGFIIRTIVQVFVCSAAAAIFSEQGLQNLGQGTWARSIPAALHWVAILFGAVLLLRCRRYDQQYQQYLSELKLAGEAHKSRKRRRNSLQTSQLLAHQHFGFKLPDTKRFSKYVYSMIVRRKTGQSLADLEGMYTSVGTVDAHMKAQKCIRDFSSYGLRQKAQALYKASNAWVRFTEPSPLNSCVFRCSLHFAQIYSKWAVAAVFFNLSARAPDQGEECEVFERFPEMMIRAAFVSALSTLLGILPFLLPLLLRRCPQSCTPVAKIISYTYTFVYFAVCNIVVCVFLSSVTLADGLKWFASGIMGLMSSLLLMPALVACASLLLLHNTSADADELYNWGPSDREGEVWRYLECRPEISISLATQRLLLCKHPACSLEVICQVAGLPETAVTLDRDEDSTSNDKDGKEDAGTWCGALSVTEEQWLRISARARSDQSDHAWELGFICLSMESLRGGFQGALELQCPRHLQAYLEANIPEPTVEIAV